MKASVIASQRKIAPSAAAMTGGRRPIEQNDRVDRRRLRAIGFRDGKTIGELRVGLVAGFAIPPQARKRDIFRAASVEVRLHRVDLTFDRGELRLIADNRCLCLVLVELRRNVSGALCRIGGCTRLTIGETVSFARDLVVQAGQARKLIGIAGPLIVELRQILAVLRAQA